MTSPDAPHVAGSRPVVGVVVPAYQAADFVVETLRSVQAQTFSSWECVVVDDGSTDSTAEKVAEVARSDPRIRLVQQENKGLSGARNTGMSALSDDVEYVAFLDSDDVWCDTMLEVLLKAMSDDEAAVGAYGYAEFLDETGASIQPGFHSARQRSRHGLTGRLKRPVEEGTPVRFDEIVVDNPIWPPAVALHRWEVVRSVGGFDTALKQLEDVDFLTRMCRFGSYVSCATQVAWYRQHPGQMTRRRAEFWLSYDTLRRKTWESEENTEEQRLSVERAWQIAQGRRLARCSVRLAQSAARRDWPAARRLFRGWRVLVGQLAHRVPPLPNIDHVLWTGRDI
ncbi:glycosyltransferase family 2 protein [Microlunatus antarcticus]|uniref:Glycosyltransferase involved in cell wall biosynthesis n=1 Tax=Microlunatus antarcticus TaxID=53388 RepID=A0A7W5P6U9_9ACTN|nr:glycosyltransferase involved in cell wall biosynthesis [Microlunatus antarcticus]